MFEQLFEMSSFVLNKLVMNVLVLGSGGREHALSWKLAQSSQMEKLYIAPGNAGTATVGENIELDPMDFRGIAEFVQANDVGIVLVGPEQPLVAGIKDFFKSRPEIKTSIIGPSASAARLEGSKNFAKQFMLKHNMESLQRSRQVGSRKEESIIKAPPAAIHQRDELQLTKLLLPRDLMLHLRLVVELIKQVQCLGDKLHVLI